MSIIRTVCGDISPAKLGICYPHEHLLGNPPKQLLTDDLQLDDLSAAISELERFRSMGGQSIVEMTTPDYGRNVMGLKALSDVTDVHIIAATGYNKEKFSASFLENVSVDEMTSIFVQEVIKGMDGSDIKAGVIKASSTLDQISPLATKMFYAAANAHHETGAPISTHTEAGTMAIEQIEFLMNEGVHPGHIIIGHLDRKLEWEYHLEIARRGVFFGYDQISKEKYYSDRMRAGMIRRLIEAGFGRQILLSGDLARRSYWPSYGFPDAPGFTYILTQFIPLLEVSGVTQSAINELLIGNPARALTFKSD